MKKSFVFLQSISYLLFFNIVQAQKQEEYFTSKWTNFNPKSISYPEVTNILEGKIETNYTLTNDKTYLLKGYVYVTNNATLTIEPGTIIRGDDESCGTLIITKGAKIVANGTKINPIIFTSNKESIVRKAGDWGGIILLGDSNINKIGGVSFLDFGLEKQLCAYGGNNIESNSGVLNYVRIEYAGRKLIKQEKELNGLSLAGIGSKTILKNIQISYSNDDSFEFYGGNVTAENLVSFRATDDDFDFTQGVQANIKNCIAIRHPFTSDASRSRCLEIDTYENLETADLTKNITQINATNLVLLNYENNNQGLIKEAIYISDKAKINLSNSIISGFRSSICLNKNINEFNQEINNIIIEKCLINDCLFVAEKEGYEVFNNIIDYFLNDKFKNQISKQTVKDLFTNSELNNQLDLRLKTEKIVSN